MKTLTILISLMTFLLTSCASQVQVDENTIKVVRIGQHPLLVDHCRKLITVDKDGNTIDEEEIYCDPGSNCNSYLFDNDSTYTVIDCNGHWFVIDKKTGQIDNDGWQWQRELPSNYLGTYKKVSGQIEYLLTKDEHITTEEVYKFKDPK